MDIDFNGETIEVYVPEGFVPTDAVLLVRAQSMHEAGEEYLAISTTPTTSGFMAHGMLSMAAAPDSYATLDTDED